MQVLVHAAACEVDSTYWYILLCPSLPPSLPPFFTFFSLTHFLRVCVCCVRVRVRVGVLGVSPAEWHSMAEPYTPKPVALWMVGVPVALRSLVGCECEREHEREREH